MSANDHKHLQVREWRRHLEDFVTVAPLLAGVIAPLSVLLDIPALTEQWYAKNGQPAPDPKASLVLSGVGLGFCLLANVALLVRFSVDNAYWRIHFALPISTLGWLVKVIVATVNLVMFGILTRNQPSYSFLEGFWCAVASDVTSGIVAALLFAHWMRDMHRRKRDKAGMPINPEVRINGRHFMLQMTWFIFLVGLTALIFSRIEGWSYYEGIYYSVVTFLTIGFGDFYPTKTSTYVLLFPLALLGITSLGALLQQILSFFSDRTAARRARSREDFERKRQEVQDQEQPPNTNIEREIEFLQNLSDNQDMWDQGVEFAISFLGFAFFWVIGAAIFSSLEGWSYGIGLYFCYIFFFAIGYGDYELVSPASRVVFIIYALIAVPIMASFALQAVTQVLTKISTWRLDKRRANTGIAKTATADAHVISHAEFVAQHRSTWDTDDAEGAAKAGEEALVRAILERALVLESHARTLLIRHLPAGGRAQVVLKADRNLQRRDLRHLLRMHERGEGGTDEDAGDKERWRELAERVGGDEQRKEGEGPMTEEEEMEVVREYRDAFAGLLVAGARLRKLEGQERLIMERWKGKEEKERKKAEAAEKVAAQDEESV